MLPTEVGRTFELCSRYTLVCLQARGKAFPCSLTLGGAGRARQRMEVRMATLADVARRAGVSAATVSRIVNGSPKIVSEELRERVLRAVQELQYVPNAHAQLLA